MYKKNKIQSNHNNQSDGFNLIEVMAAMIILATCLAYAMPVILYSKINNSKSEMRAGALIVSQKVFDNIRGKTFGSIPSLDTTITNTTTTDAAFPVLSSDQTTALGRNYNVSIRYCPPDPANPCSPNFRFFTITIRDPRGLSSSENSILYQTQASFSNFN